MGFTPKYSLEYFVLPEAVIIVPTLPFFPVNNMILKPRDEVTCND